MIRSLRFGLLPTTPLDTLRRRSFHSFKVPVIEFPVHSLNPPEEVMLATNSYRTATILGQSIDACCIRDDEARETTRRLHQAYDAWCLESGIEPMPCYLFDKEMKRRDFEPAGPTWKGWAGLGLRDKSA